MNPIWEILQNRRYELWDVHTQFNIRNEILNLGIQGLVDVQFDLGTNNNYRVTPVFANEQDWIWYNLKYPQFDNK